MRREGFAVFRCAACATAFCAGCDEPEIPRRGQGWLAAAQAESSPQRCPACTEPVGESDQVGVIAGRQRGET
jgi:hypothetical protein